MSKNSNMPTLLAEAQQLGAVVAKLNEAQALMQTSKPGKSFAKRGALYLEAAGQLERLHQLVARTAAEVVAPQQAAG